MELWLLSFTSTGVYGRTPRGNGESARAKEIRGTNKHTRRMWPETHMGMFPEAPLGHSEKQTWLREYFLCLSKGEWLTVNGTKHYRQGSRTMYFELTEPQEKAACFHWE